MQKPSGLNWTETRLRKGKAKKSYLRKLEAGNQPNGPWNLSQVKKQSQPEKMKDGKVRWEYFGGAVVLMKALSSPSTKGSE